MKSVGTDCDMTSTQRGLLSVTVASSTSRSTTFNTARWRTSLHTHHVTTTFPSGGTPSNINIIYTSLKSTFSGLQCCHRQYGTVFFRAAIVASQIFTIKWNSKKIRTYSSSRSFKVTDLIASRKHMYNFVLVINSNYGRISYRFLTSTFLTDPPIWQTDGRAIAYSMLGTYTVMR